MAQEQIPLTAVIVDDGGYGMLRYDQDLAGDERYGVDLHTPDFAALAAPFGVRAETVDGLDDDFGAALAQHVADPSRRVLVAQTPDPLVPPPNTSPNWYRRRRLMDREQVLAYPRRRAPPARAAAGGIRAGGGGGDRPAGLPARARGLGAVGAGGRRRHGSAGDRVHVPRRGGGGAT